MGLAGWHGSAGREPACHLLIGLGAGPAVGAEGLLGLYHCDSWFPSGRSGDQRSRHRSLSGVWVRKIPGGTAPPHDGSGGPSLPQASPASPLPPARPVSAALRCLPAWPPLPLAPCFSFSGLQCFSSSSLPFCVSGGPGLALPTPESLPKLFQHKLPLPSPRLLGGEPAARAQYSHVM